MNYVWPLFDDTGELQGVFKSPGLAFRSLERTHGVGLVRVLHRSAKVWKIRIKSNGMFLCTRWRLLDKPISS